MVTSNDRCGIAGTCTLCSNCWREHRTRWCFINKISTKTKNFLLKRFYEIRSVKFKFNIMHLYKNMYYLGNEKMTTEDMERVCRIANAHNFIKELPKVIWISTLLFQLLIQYFFFCDIAILSNSFRATKHVSVRVVYSYPVDKNNVSL